MDAVTNVSLGIAFVAGFLSFISPCVLPLIPAYVTYLGGRATMQVSREITAEGLPGATVMRTNRLGTLTHGIFFVAGFTLVFVVFGVLTNASILAVRNQWVDLQKFLAHWGGILIILFGLHVLGITGWLLRKLIEGGRKQESHTKAGALLLNSLEGLQGFLYGDTRQQIDPRNPYGYAGSAIMGVTFAAGWTPCIGPIYGAILTMAIGASTHNNYGQVASLLLAYSLGLGVPFLLASIALDQVRGLLKRIQRQMRIIELVSGALLIIIGYMLITDSFSYINQYAIGLNNFSYNLEGCTTEVLQGQIPSGDYGTCMNLGPDYKQEQQPS